eukprot:6189584-Pleurochrysis_carterae.AAC.2
MYGFIGLHPRKRSYYHTIPYKGIINTVAFIRDMGCVSIYVRVASSVLSKYGMKQPNEQQQQERSNNRP